MLTRWPIRNKLLTGIGLLLVIVGALGWSGFQGPYAYRSLVRSLNSRAAELPLASALSQQVATLRITMGEVRGGQEVAKFDPAPHPFDKAAIGREFMRALAAIHQTLDDYRAELATNSSGSHSIDDSQQEWLTISQIDDCLAAIDRAASGEAWIDDDLPGPIGSMPSWSDCKRWPPNCPAISTSACSSSRTKFIRSITPGSC